MSRNKKQNNNKEIYIQRKQCDCVAQKHELINNCLICGKVVCALQGQGPCFFCGNIVSRPDSNYMSTNDESIFPSLPKQQLIKISQQRSKAILHRNILVERDKDKDQIQNIFDDQMDYYQVTQNQWIDQQDRQKAVDKILEKDKNKQKQQLIHRVKFDPLTGKFIRQEFQFDQQAFRKQGNKFGQEKQQKDIKQKNKFTFNKAWDARLMNSQKLKDLCQQLQIGSKEEKKKKQNINKRINDIAELIIEDQQQQK